MDFPLKKLFWLKFHNRFWAATKQLYEWFRLSVSLSLSLSYLFISLCTHHGIIMKFSGVITNDRNDVHAKGQGQRSKVKVTEVKTQLSHFWTITPVWFHIWWWNDAQSLMSFGRVALLIFKVICQISRSHSSKNCWFRTKKGISRLYLQYEFTDGYEMMHKVWSSIEEVPYWFFMVIRQISRSRG